MTDLAAACRGLVGATLLLAGFAKLRRPDWAATATRFGTPAVVVPVLPWIELVLGALLLTGAAGWAPTVAALVLMALFTGVVASRLAAGRRAPCGCFGEADAVPLGLATLVRNGLLLVACALALGGSGSPAVAVTSGAVVGAAVVGVSRLRHRALRR